MSGKPGPGWRKTKDGRYVPHLFTESDFGGAQTVAGIFQLLGWLVIVLGVIVDWQTRIALSRHGPGGGTALVVLLGIAGATILVSSTLFFFGYVLRLLVALHFDAGLPEATRRAEDSP